ncbi:hypothetical protein JQX08_02715 [Pseudomonas sp. UL073]|uniref:Uncharacterized protein n=1 Tax=Zestomonas insulae TaxID=2809017 RepID=A0ABS2I9H4_9GAMM|nr:hypothetical protein [Pseudomonas insulae]MBM7059612.1 hypothetical protein [Pseudomonas insulae]
MSKAALTLKWFAVYLALLGLILVLVPNLPLQLMGMTLTHEVWIRVVGVLAFNIGLYYWFAAGSESRAFFLATVYSRALVLAAFAGFVAFQLGEPLLILFGAIDCLGGLWTLRAVRQDDQTRLALAR